MSQFVRRHPLSAFLFAVYAYALAVYAVPVLSEAGIGLVPIALPGIAPFLLVLTFGMVGIAYAVTAIAEGREGVRNLRSRMLRFRVAPVWYGAAVVVLPLFAVIAAVVVAGPSVLATIGSDPGVAIGWLADILMAAILINFWEEVAWTGFVLHRLQQRVGPVRATALTTWAQAALHVPLLVVAGGLSEGRVPVEMYPVFLVALFVLPLGNRTVVTWLYNRSGGSIPVAGLAHSAFNLATGSAFAALATGYLPIWSYAGFAAAAALVLVATRGRLGHAGSKSEALAASSVGLAAESAA